MASEATLTLTLESRDEAVLLFGSRDQFLRLIRDAMEVRLIARGNTIQIEGTQERVGEAERVFEQLRQMLRQHGKLTAEDVRTVLEIVRQHDALAAPDSGGFMGGPPRARPPADVPARHSRPPTRNNLTFAAPAPGTAQTS